MCRAFQMTKKLRNRKQTAAHNYRTFVRILCHISMKEKVSYCHTEMTFKIFFYRKRVFLFVIYWLKTIISRRKTKSYKIGSREETNN